MFPTTQQKPAAAPANPAQKTRTSQEDELVQLRARLAVAEAARAALKST